LSERPPTVQQASVAQDLTTRWDAFKALWAQGQWGSGTSRGQSAHARGVIASLDALNADANQIAKLENIEGAQRHQTALANERSSRRTMIIALVVGLLASVVWLTRTSSGGSLPTRGLRATSSCVRS
jgi:hypothetical protein